MSKMSREEKLERRLSSYPMEMWDVLQAAMKGQGYTRGFAEHHQAVSFIARFYKFRMDAIEAKVAGAIALRELTATGRDALGGLLTTRGPGAGGPYTVTWMHSGHVGLIAPIAEAPTRAGTDQTEAMLGELLTEQSKENVVSEADLALHGKQREALSSGLPADLEQALCEHEADSTGTFCLKCRVPM